MNLSYTARKTANHSNTGLNGLSSGIFLQLTGERRLERCPLEAWALYLFLVTVADARGLSYYSDASLTARLPIDHRALLDARQALISADLIAFEPPLYQVLSLDVHAPAEPPPQRSATPRRLSEVLEQLRRPT